MCVECLLVPQHAPDDSSELVGQGSGELVAMHARRRVLQPRSEAELTPVVRSHQDDVRRLDEQRAQISTAPLRDSAQDRAPASAVLPWDQAEPRAEVATPVERFATSDRGNHSRRDQGADAGDAHQANAVGLLLAELLDLAADA